MLALLLVQLRGILLLLGAPCNCRNDQLLLESCLAISTPRGVQDCTWIEEINVRLLVPSLAVATVSAIVVVSNGLMIMLLSLLSFSSWNLIPL